MVMLLLGQQWITGARGVAYTTATIGCHFEGEQRALSLGQCLLGLFNAVARIPLQWTNDRLLLLGVLDNDFDVALASMRTAIDHLCARTVQVAKNTEQLINQRAQNVEQKYDGK